MRIKEKFTADETENLFEKINALTAFPWADTFPPIIMSEYWIFAYGNRVLNSNAETATLDNLAQMLSGLFYDKWSTLYSSLLSDQMRKLGYSETITETIKDDGNTTTVETENNVGKVSAFDENTFEDKTSDETTKDGKGTSANNRTREYTRIGYGDNVQNQKKAAIELFTKNYIYDIIFKDVNRILTKPILVEE